MEEDYVIARDIILKYGFGDEARSTDRFTVSSADAHLMLEQIVYLMDEFNIDSWGVKLKDNYVTTVDKLWNKRQIYEYIATNVGATIDQYKALKLTK